MDRVISGLSILAGLCLALAAFMGGIANNSASLYVLSVVLISTSVSAWRGAGLKFLAAAWAMVIGTALPLASEIVPFAWQFGCGQLDYAGGSVVHLGFESLVVYLLAIPMLIAALLLDRRGP